MGTKEWIEGSGWAALFNNRKYPSTIINPGGVRYSKGFRLSGLKDSGVRNSVV